MSRSVDRIAPSALEVLRICEEGGYRHANEEWVELAEALAEAEAGTRLFTPEELRDLRSGGARSGDLLGCEIVDATTQEAAAEQAEKGPVALLNFASGRNSGGGFLAGARAQEEDLCRCSGLYPTLLTQPDYYEANRASRSALYTDHIIYSPRVPFFRVESDGPLLDVPFLASVITAPAPNLRAFQPDQTEDGSVIEETFARRWANVLAVARETGQRAVVLGAWGCGAFGNDPSLVARSAQSVLESGALDGVFERVIFAIPSRWPRSKVNLEVFRRVWGD